MRARMITPGILATAICAHLEPVKPYVLIWNLAAPPRDPGVQSSWRRVTTGGVAGASAVEQASPARDVTGAAVAATRGGVASCPASSRGSTRPDG
jgi:hypothetical protein